MPDTEKVTIRTSKIIEMLISIMLSVVIGGSFVIIWTSVTEQEDRIEEAVSQVEARLTAVIETHMEQMQVVSDETEVLREELERVRLELLALHVDDKVMNLPSMPAQQTFDPKNYKDSINTKQQHYYQQKK